MLPACSSDQAFFECIAFLAGDGRAVFRCFNEGIDMVGGMHADSFERAILCTHRPGGVIHPP